MSLTQHTVAPPAPALVFGHEQRIAVASGVRAITETRADDPDLDAKVRQALYIAEAPRAWGSVAFSPTGTAHFTVPDRVQVVTPGDFTSMFRAGAPDGTVLRAELPEAAAFAEAVGRAIELISASCLDKVVLGRWLHLEFAEPVSVPTVVSRLLDLGGPAWVYAMPQPEGGTLVGASPELLVRRRGQIVESSPLAGSLPRSVDPATLVESAKDQHEHRLVVEQIADTLAPHCRQLDVPAPELFATDSMWHLGTRIRGELRPDAPGVIALAQHLHPTPAVCGSPTGIARERIAELEPADRGPMTGWVAHVDGDGNGQAVLAIRSALIHDSTARLFAGAGVVAGSTPDGEVAETAAKFTTMLRALGLQPALGADR